MKKNFTTIILSVAITTMLAAQDFIQIPNIAFSSQVAVADFDGDGHPDIFSLVNRYNELNRVSLFRNAGENTFSFSEEVIVNSHPAAGNMSPIDYDNDGDMDVIMSQEESLDIMVFENDGTGQFTAVDLGISGSCKLRVGDVDNDGDLDIVGMDNAEGRLDVYRNTGNGYSKLNVISTEDDIRSFDLADIDGDGDLDIAVCFSEFSGRQVALYKNNNGSFQLKVLVADDWWQMRQVKIEDLDGDGLKDIVVIGTDVLLLLRNINNTDFEEQVLLSPQSGWYFYRFGFGDYNGDHKLDLVVSHGFNGIYWYANTSEGTTLSFEESLLGGVSPAGQFINVDIDQDGDLDMLTQNGDMWWYENQVTQLPNSTIELSDKTIQLSPNPFQTHIHLDGIGEGRYQYQIATITGESVQTGQLNTNQIDGSTLGSGTYFLTLWDMDTGRASTAKLIKMQ